MGKINLEQELFSKVHTRNVISDNELDNSDRKLENIRFMVTLTSYPERIKYVKNVVECLLKQNIQPERVVLYLAAEQFPGQEADLPAELLDYIHNGQLLLEWCNEDLKSHKKYYYAMQQFPDELIITVDDDEILPVTATEELLKSWLNYPNAVSARRAHLITCSEEGELLPYDRWIKEYDGCVQKPSMQLMATGCAGVLYPPHLFGQQLFDMDAILATCLYADDLWLKAMELLYDIPVVLSSENVFLHHIDGSQENGLFYRNVNGHENDIQLEKISDYLGEKYGESPFFQKKIFGSEIGENLSRKESLQDYIFKMTEKYRMTDAKLQRTYKEKSELNKKLQQTYVEKSELNKRLQQTFDEKSELNRKLKQTYAEKTELNQKLQKAYQEKTQRGEKIKELEQRIAYFENTPVYKIYSRLSGLFFRK